MHTFEIVVVEADLGECLQDSFIKAKEIIAEGHKRVIIRHQAKLVEVWYNTKYDEVKKEILRR